MKKLDDEPKLDVMEIWEAEQRIELVYTNERTERHLMPMDHPPVPHRVDADCWCGPELRFKGKRWSVYRHKRIQ